ncbi:unnamed protein product [Caenorhabditis brenneri]
MRSFSLKAVRLSGKTIGFTEIQKRVPSVNFERIIKNLITPDKREETWTKIAGKIAAKEYEFVFNNTMNFETILRTTPKRALANTFITFFIMSEFQKIKREEINNCAGMTTSTFPLAALRIIVRNHFDKENIEIASKMVEDIRQSFIEMIQESTWLNEKTKQNAIRKAEMMRKMVGYPKELEVPGALDSFFETFVFPSNDSFHKLINAVEKFKIEQAINFVASSIQLQSQKDYFEANALYAPWRNLLTLNIPFIDDPFFDSTYPDYAKIASIGGVLGHEIGHGFDPNGRKFDENGKLNDWWAPEDSSEYDRRAQCLIDQYNNYDDPDFGKNLNGSKTIKEIASDTIGINTAWRTYKKLNLVNEPKIIGFEDYDTDKLFFRLAALNWCNVRSTHSLSEQLTLVHPTSSFRVNGIFSNTKSFAKAYNCPIGSPMNPAKKFFVRIFTNSIHQNCYLSSTTLDQQTNMTTNDEKSKPNQNHHPIKLICFLLVWIVSLYIILDIIKNYNVDSSSESPEYSRPSLVKSSENICKSPECIQLAHYLHNWQDISVDPCQDFYQAVCGKYNEHSTVAEGRINERGRILYQLVKEHLDKNLPTTSKSENAMKLYYQKCEETKRLNTEKLRNETMKEIYQTIMKVGKWPTIDESWEESDFDLNEMMDNIAKIGKTDFGFFKIRPASDKYLFVATEFTFGDLWDLLMENKTGQIGDSEFGKYTKQFDEVNNIKPVASYWDDTYKLMRLVDMLSNMNRTYEGYKGFATLKEQVPSVDFERIIKNYMNPSRKDEMWSKTVKKIAAGNEPYWFNKTHNLELILKTASKRTLANFLMTNLFLEETYTAFMEEKFRNSKDSECSSVVIKTFPLAALRIFVRNHFDKENLEIVSKMVEDFRSNFVEMIEESTWLNDKTKMSAIRKLEKMKTMVGYPKDMDVPGALDSYFETLNLSKADSYYTFNSKIQKFKMEQAMDFLTSGISIESSEEYFQVNAWYGPRHNNLAIDVGIIDDPFFDSTFPEYAKIASVGEVIGHEMGHGFDPVGRTFDEDGNEKDWWTPEDSAEYDRRAQCLVDQYNNYDDPNYGRKLNGSTSIQEIAADLIGINVSWKTYKKLDLTNEPKILGFEDYSTDKLFFRLTAHMWCGGRSGRPLSTQLQLVHPTHSFRVNGVFSNMKSFAEAYNCPVGSPMNPAKKCELF